MLYLSRVYLCNVSPVETGPAPVVPPVRLDLFCVFVDAILDGPEGVGDQRRVESDYRLPYYRFGIGTLQSPYGFLVIPGTGMG